MKIKLKTLLIALIIFLFLVFTFGIYFGDKRRQASVDHNQDLLIMATIKQVPYVARYMKLVRELEKASRGKLTAYEIVEISKVIIIQCEVHGDIGLTPAIVMAIIERESAFNPDAISRARAYGLTQCIRAVFEQHLPELGYGRRFSKDLALNPIINVEVGIRHLVYLRKYWLAEGIDSWPISISSYFWGIRLTTQLITEKKRTKLPSLEYGIGVLKLAKAWQARGVS